MLSPLQSRFLRTKRKCFDASKRAKTTNRILLTVIFLLFAFGVIEFRAFTIRHPGLIAVLIGVAGEVYFDWKKEVGREALLRKVFMAFLVLGLSYELFEASNTDKEAANAIELASKANERTATIESNNLVLEAKLLPRTIT